MLRLEIELGAIDVEGDPAEESVAVDGALSTASAEATRAERVRRDEEIYRRAVEALLAIDPDVLQEYFQVRLRDQQLSRREQDVGAAEGAAREQARVREEQYRRAEEAERARQEADFFGAMFKCIAAIVSAVVNALGAIGSAFTGGASLAATVALTVALLGPLVVNGLAELKVIDDPQIANCIQAVIATVAAICSFGAGTASAVSAVATAVAVAAPAVMTQLAREGVIDPQAAGIVGTAIAVVASLVACGAGIERAAESTGQAAYAALRRSLQVAEGVGQVVEGAGRVGQGGFQVAAAVHQGERDHATADARAADVRVEMHVEAMEESSEALADIFRAARRVAQRMQEIREARAEAMSVATMAFARA
jgi:hypothetical protein